MDELDKLKEHLQKLDYPDINNLNETQVAELFETENRKFLLTWILNKHLNLQIPFSPENDDLELANCVCELGFCTSSEKFKFIRGGLNYERELKIFFRIFNFFLSPKETLTDLVETEEVDLQQLTDLQKLISVDLNLFPSYGPIKRRTAQEREDIIQKLKEDLNNINAKVEANRCTEVEEEHLNIHNDQIVKLEEIFKDLIRFYRDSYSFTAKKFIIKDNKMEFGSKFEDTLSKTNEYIQKINSYLDNIQTFDKFYKKISENNVKSSENIELFPYINEINLLLNSLKLVINNQY